MKDRWGMTAVVISIVIFLAWGCVRTGDSNAGKQLQETYSSYDNEEEIAYANGSEEELYFADNVIYEREQDPILHEELIAIPASNILSYGSASKAVVYSFVRSEGIGENKTKAGFLGQFLLHGHPCEYQDGKIVMLHYFCNDTCPYRETQ